MQYFARIFLRQLFVFKILRRRWGRGGGLVSSFKFRVSSKAVKADIMRTCKHVKANGEFCGSPALRGREYCYFHLTVLGRRLRTQKHIMKGENHYLQLPTLEDANSIQMALMQVMEALLRDQTTTSLRDCCCMACRSPARICNTAPILPRARAPRWREATTTSSRITIWPIPTADSSRSEEHTSELQS